jgi:hypothetical protein
MLEWHDMIELTNNIQAPFNLTCNASLELSLILPTLLSSFTPPPPSLSLPQWVQVLRRVLRLSCWRYCFLKQGNHADYSIMNDKSFTSPSSSRCSSSTTPCLFHIRVSKSLDLSIIHLRFTTPATLHNLYPVKAIGIFLCLTWISKLSRQILPLP